jgi:hypothetical protein
MKPTFVSSPGIKDLPISLIEDLQGEFYLIGTYASELNALLEPKFTFRNVIISDYASAKHLFWSTENSKIRMLATNALILPLITSPITFLWGRGFSSLEQSSDAHWHWSVGDERHGYLHLYNWVNDIRTVYVDFSVESNLDESSPLKIEFNNAPLEFCNENGKISLTPNLSPGENILKFTVSKSAKRISQEDSRNLNFRILNFLLTDEHSLIGTSDLFARWKLHEEGFATVLNLNSGLETKADGFKNYPHLGNSKTGSPSSSPMVWYMALAL